MGSQVPTHVNKSQLLSLKKSLKYGLHSLKLDLNYFTQKSSRLVLRVKSRFLFDPTLNTSPKPHLEKNVAM